MNPHTLPAAQRRFPRRTVALHWLSAIAIVGAFAFVWLREAVDGTALRAALLLGHTQMGLLVLGMLLLRVATRLRSRPLAAEPGLSAWQQRAAAASHGLLYLLLLAQPVLGWLSMNSHGKPVLLFGLMALPMLAGADPDLADRLGDLHEATGWALLALAGLHAAAALWHHFVRRDGVLTAMWPRPPRSPLPALRRTERSPS